MTDLKEPNLYDLSCDGIELTYSTTSSDGSARFSFRDAERKLNFSGEQIQTHCGGRPLVEFETLYELGDLVSLVA